MVSWSRICGSGKTQGAGWGEVGGQPDAEKKRKKQKKAQQGCATKFQEKKKKQRGREKKGGLLWGGGKRGTRKTKLVERKSGGEKRNCKSRGE